MIDRMRAPRLLGWWDGRWRSLALDIALAAAFATTTPHWLTSASPAWLSTALGVVEFAALVLRRRLPWLALAVSALRLSTGTALGIYTLISRRGPGWQACGACGLGAGVTAAITFWDLTRVSAGERAVLGVFFLGVLVVFPAVLGLWVHARRRLLGTLRERAEQAEREQDLLAERAVSGERRRIAREMHDVVAHRVSIISLQAGALTMTAQDAKSAEIAEVIRTASATALAELREMLRALRDDSDGSVAAAQALSGIADLVADTSAAGADISLALPEPVPETSTAVGRAAYRVVQEALTNATKHAAGAPVRVHVSEQPGGGLAVEVRNGPARRRAAVEGSGYGLIGMRERVTLAGGTLRTERTPDGGYRVRAEFPATEPAAASESA